MDDAAGDAARKAEVRAHPAVDPRRGQARLGADHLGLGAGEKTHDAHGVRADVHRRTAGEIEPVADVARQEEGNAEDHLDVAQAAELARVDDLPHPRRQRMVSPVKRFAEQLAGALGRLGHARGLRGVGGQRLLAEHVLACLERTDRPCAVQAVRQRIVDGVDLGIGEQRLVGRVRAWEAVLGRELLGSRAVARGDRRNDDVRDVARRANQRHRRDPRGSENADANGSCWSRLRLRARAPGGRGSKVGVNPT